MIPYVRHDWLRLLVAAHGSFARGVPLRVLTFGAIASVVTLLDAAGLPLRTPVGLHEIAGGVVALVLVFRTNTSYARFWEGRTLWGAIVNACRSLARIVHCHTAQDPTDAREFVTWVVLFAHATRRSLRRESIAPEAERLLASHEASTLAQAVHPALSVAEQLSRRLAALVARGAIDPMMATLAERQIVVLVDSLGGCERIAKTPTPLGYVLLMQRFMALALATLPLSLVGRVGVATPLITMAVAYPLLMVEALGSELDEPFGHDANDLPLTRICQTIEQDLLGRAAEPSVRLSHGVGPAEH